MTVFKSCLNSNLLQLLKKYTCELFKFKKLLQSGMFRFEGIFLKNIWCSNFKKCYNREVNHIWCFFWTVRRLFFWNIQIWMLFFFSLSCLWIRGVCVVILTLLRVFDSAKQSRWRIAKIILSYTLRTLGNRQRIYRNYIILGAFLCATFVCKV